MFRRIGQAIKGPTIGMDYDTGYLMWEVRDYRDVARRGQYASFPLDLPRQKRVENIQLEQGWNSSEMYPIDRQHSPLLVALSAEVTDSLWASEIQIIVVTMAPGETPEHEVWGLASGGPKGRPALFAPGHPRAIAEDRLHGEYVALRQVAEQVVTASNVPSMKPTLLMDDSSNLHLAWLESAGFRQYRVIYASTAPEVLENYNALTLFDIVDPVLKRVFRLSLVVVAAGPMFVLWALLPLGGLLVYHVLTGEETLETLHSRVALAIAIAIEVGLTFVFTPTAVSDLPMLRWITPVITATLAGALTIRTLRRREKAEESLLLTSFFIFTIIYCLLQLVVYFLL